ncbi:MAG TPA: hypothetical protein VFB82_03795 [Blastocatellia bacterium]|jgi:hypothetical protein|nr:hypothetical protein [Blastocatellia bacterium]
MGLVLLELTLRIEETFAIQIPDNVAYTLTTPGKVTDYILTQVGESQVSLPCLSQSAFLLVRRAFIERLSLPRQQLRLNTALEEILPKTNRADVWKDIGLSIGVKNWPTMSRPKWMPLIPATVESIRDLVEYLVTNEPLAVKGDESEWSRAQVSDVLRRVIIKETLVDDFSEDSRFVEDMRLS